MKSIYKYYRERLIEISGRNRSLYAKNVSKKYAYDLGKIFDGDYEAIKEFVDFLWTGKKDSFSVIDRQYRDRIAKNLGVEDKIKKSFKDTAGMTAEEEKAELSRRDKLRRDESKKIVQTQVNNLKNLKREIEEFAKETGRYELYVGYPFVEGSIKRELVIKAPLLLFPVVINIENENSVQIELKPGESIQLNKVFVLAYAKAHNLNLEDMVLEFDNLLDYKLKSIEDVVAYLRNHGFSIGYSNRKGMFDYNRGREPQLGDSLEVKHLCVVGRFPLANSIYNDYAMLERKKLSCEAIDELLESRACKPVKKPDTRIFTINPLDYAQEHAIESLNQNGNMVLYGPPGTGKSQTIVNIITDALCKNKRVLVVSQKKAALDVVYNRLGLLNNRVVLIPDAEKNKVEFYERVKTAHFDLMADKPIIDYSAQIADVQQKLQKEISNLEMISDVLFTEREYGLCLQQMYANSDIIGKNSNDYKIYQAMLQDKKLMSLKYQELSEAVRIIKEKRQADLYYKFIEMQKNNPLISHMLNDLDVHLVNTARNFVAKLINKRIAPFDTGKYPNARQLLAFYLENGIEEQKELKPLIKLIAKLENPHLYQSLNASKVLFPAYPFVKYQAVKKEKVIYENFEKTLSAVKEYVKEYELLSEVLDKKGYTMTIDNILNGNTLFLKLLLSALDDYVTIRDMNIALTQLGDNERLLLNFAYSNSNTLSGFKYVIDRLLTIRTYHEVVYFEDNYKQELSKIQDYDNIRNRIVSLQNEQKKLVRAMCSQKFVQEYRAHYAEDKENKNYLYQITKQQNLWSIRRLMEHYGDYLLDLFPCWLLSPENVSNIMPLTKELFDIVLFDEASQVFIENTIPTIYRGKYIVVAGDNKQLRPSATFVKRYLGNADDDLDLSTQTALEVESLLDLATSRYNSTNLTYHYRSKNEELISFSNYAFYDGKLQISPNITKNVGAKPIERIKVNGFWIDRHNEKEANAVVETIKKIFKTRKNNETIGIITFNAEQELFIEDKLDQECEKNIKFRNEYLRETNRKDNGEDVSLFIKNLENVQGDERDIIIFCIGYARNEYGKVVAQFGPLSLEGGENRLNVAITRAKSKIIVITSIEPEELLVDNSKNAGPKLLKKYLQYVRAVSKGNQKETQIILDSLKQTSIIPFADTGVDKMQMLLKSELEKLGYAVETNLGNSNYKLPLAIYDKKLDRYLLGIEFDYNAYLSSSSCLERDVYRPVFLQSRGWNITRVWSRDLWQHKQKVIQSIERDIEKAREKIYKSLNLTLA